MKLGPLWYRYRDAWSIHDSQHPQSSKGPFNREHFQVEISPNQPKSFSWIIPKTPISFSYGTLPCFHFPVFSYGDNLFIGLAQGSLLQYGVVMRPGAPPEVQLLRSNKNFSRHPVTQIHVVPEEQILVTITNGMVSVHDIGETLLAQSGEVKLMTISCFADMAVTHFPWIYRLEASSGCHSFSLSVQRIPDNDGNIKVGIVRYGLWTYGFYVQVQSLYLEILFYTHLGCVWWWGKSFSFTTGRTGSSSPWFLMRWPCATHPGAWLGGTRASAWAPRASTVSTG